MFYFFETSQQLREGELKPTLRALPCQFMEDGGEVDTSLNVHSPKKAGQYPGGNRLDYPDGTVFCSDHLELIVTQYGKQFYSVFPSGDESKTPNFHPVSLDPNFQYVDNAHRSEEMNLAYATYRATGSNTTQAAKKPAKRKKTAATKSAGESYGPADRAGKAKALSDAATQETYAGQIDIETQHFIRWMNRILADQKVRPQIQATVSSLRTIIEELYGAGENIETLTCRQRLNNYMSEAHIPWSDLVLLGDGPHKAYLSYIYNEHKNGLKCSATARNHEGQECKDALEILNDAVADLNGSRPIFIEMNPTIEENFKKALDAGWTLDSILDPERMKNYSELETYVSALSDGTIEPPKKNIPGSTLIDKICADPKNRKPDDKDGFHVDDEQWTLLIRNLKVHQNTLITGPSGTGKTEIVRMLCERTGTPLTIVQMGSITDPTEQLVGKMDLDPATGGTRYDWADFALAIQRPGVILLDEINRIPKNGENILFSCLDKTRELNASGAKSTEKRIIKVNPECVFFATANIGSEYTGTKEIDLATRTRFMPVEMEYLDVKTEKAILKSKTGISDEDANNIAFVANEIRRLASKDEIQNSVSTRETVMCAELVRDGYDVENAMYLCFLPIFDRGAGKNDRESERWRVRSTIFERFKTEKLQDEVA